jgi:hypothetical protein
MCTFLSHLLSSFGQRAFLILFLAFMFDVEHQGQEQFCFALGFLESSKLWNLELPCLAKSKYLCSWLLCLVLNIEAESKKHSPKVFWKFQA